jgi:hypothetical protein
VKHVVSVWLARTCSYLLVLVVVSLAGCAQADPTPTPEAEAEAEEILARTAFTERIENFFEYSPLKSGEASPFLIHLTDLEDGSPVAQAAVGLSVRTSSGEEVVSTRAAVGRVTGIYVAELVVPRSGNFEIEFHVRNDKLDETMVLSEFAVQ